MLTQSEYNQIKYAIEKMDGIKNDDDEGCTPDENVFGLLRLYTKTTPDVMPPVATLIDRAIDQYTDIHVMNDEQVSVLKAFLLVQFGSR